MKREQSKNFRAHEVCPECGKKGLYTRRMLYCLDMMVKRCKYCHYESKPFSLTPPKDRTAENLQMIRELNELLDNFMEKWRIPNANHMPRLPHVDRVLPGTESELPPRFTDAERHAALRL
jgi:hypothetical protein